MSNPPYIRVERIFERDRNGQKRLWNCSDWRLYPHSKPIEQFVQQIQ
ncbi:hypothetical protein [Coleofasciculus sp.]